MSREGIETYDAVIVGAGFAGMYMLHRLRGMGMRVRVYEAAGGVGGTWYWNRYPGARCDVESMQYSYQFSADLQQEWTWSERYAPQPEILAYADHVADRFDLRRDIQFNSRVTSADYEEQSRQWRIEIEGNPVATCRFLISAVGCLSAANTPNIPGLETFAGDVYHTGHWPHREVSLEGRRVGVIGTGSSAIQAIPEIAKEAAHLTVFQRTPNYTIPAQNRPLSAAEQAEIKANYPTLRRRALRTFNGVLLRKAAGKTREFSAEERQAEFEHRWAEGGVAFLGAYTDLLVDKDANDIAAEFVRDKIRKIVKDPAAANLLSPDNVFGCKRLCVDTDYYATYNRNNVALVDISNNPIEAVTPEGLQVGGRHYAFDTLILATGFDAMTGSLLRMNIRGRGGLPLTEKWHGGPRTYLGLTTYGFPNLFTITGPGSPSVLANMIVAIEQHVDWIADCLAFMRDNNHSVIEADLSAEDDWVAHVNSVVDGTLRASCSSWYLGANVPGKPRVYMPYLGGLPSYIDKCKAVASNGYSGFAFTGFEERRM